MAAPLSIPVEYRPLVKSILGPNAEVITAVAAKLYFSKPDPNKWTDVSMEGALALVAEANSLSLILVDLSSEMVLWTRRLTAPLDYVQDLPYFHSIPGEDCMIGICFSKTPEAIQFYDLVYKKLDLAKSSEKTEDKAPNASKPSSKKRPEIGAPVGFKHVSHVGFDPETGFSLENIPDDWRTVFSQAGVTNEQLQNKETAAFIYEFMNQNQHVSTDEAPPKPPSRPAPNAPGREAPPPPQLKRSTVPPPPPILSPRASPQASLPTTSSLPAASADRQSLLSSIRSAGVQSLKTTPTTPSANQANIERSSSPTNIMASLLKQALADRSKHLSTGANPGASDDDDW